jgi:hypothetical protein
MYLLWYNFTFKDCIMSSWDRSVNIMTIVDCRSDILWFDPWKQKNVFCFSKMSKLDLGPPIINTVMRLRMSWTIPLFSHVTMLCIGTTLYTVGLNFIQNNSRDYNDVIMSFTCNNGTDFNKISGIIFQTFFTSKTY